VACTSPAEKPDDSEEVVEKGESPETIDDETVASVDAMARRMIESGRVPGLAIGLVRGDARSVRTFGFARPEEKTPGEGEPVTEETVFEIGSTTKVFTATMLADMVADGEVELDTPVAKLLGEGWKIPSRGESSVTLEHLATHTSGLPRMPTNFAPSDMRDPYADYTAEELRTFLAGTSATGEPGATYRYSNLGMGLLGHALSTRAKGDYEEALARRVLTPLGIEDIAWTLDESMRTRMAQGYDADGKMVPNWTFAALGGAGALRADVGAMVRFVEANLAPPEGALGRALEMTRERRVERGDGGYVGLGWHIDDTEAGPLIWHNGQTGGFHSYVAFDPDSGTGVVVLSNAASMTVDELGRAAMRVLRGRDADFDLPRIVEVPGETLASYVGTYRMAPNFALEVTLEGDELYVQATGQPKLRVYPVDQRRFRYRAVDAAITFQLDDEGRVTGLVLDQGGRKLPAKRVEDADSGDTAEGEEPAEGGGTQGAP
jgi:CubicO group peptidase (beta-lactamase class C family)